MYAGGFYAYSIFALVFWETRRSDFGVSMGHHIVSVSLIALSYILRYVSRDSTSNFFSISDVLGALILIPYPKKEKNPTIM